MPYKHLQLSYIYIAEISEKLNATDRFYQTTNFSVKNLFLRPLKEFL